MKFIFFDTNFWIDISRDKTLELEAFDWCEAKEVTPIIHPLLYLELFQSRSHKGFYKLWKLICKGQLSKQSQIKLIGLEIWQQYIYSENSSDILTANTSHLIHDKSKKLFQSIVKEAQKFPSLLEQLVPVEVFTKTTLKSNNSTTTCKIESLLHLLQETEQSKLSIDKAPLSSICHKKLFSKYSNLHKNVQSFVDAIDHSMLKDTVSSIEWLIDKFQFNQEELLDMSIQNFNETVYFFKLCNDSFNENHLTANQWEDFQDFCKELDTHQLPGFNLFQNLKQHIRKGEAKVKHSDVVDFFNIIFLPYVEYYITDGAIKQAIFQIAPRYKEKTYSMRCFKSMLK